MQQIDLRDPQEAVPHAACIGKSSCDDATRVDCDAVRECGARRVKRSDGAVGIPQEAMTVEPRGTVVSSDGARWVDGERRGVDRARRIERGEGAIGAPQIAAREVNGKSRDRPSRIDAGRDARICIDHGEGAVGSPQEALVTCDSVAKISHDHSRWVNGEGLGERRAREIDGREGAVGSPQEPVRNKVWINIDSRNRPGWVDAGRWTTKSI